MSEAEDFKAKWDGGTDIVSKATAAGAELTAPDNNLHYLFYHPDEPAQRWKFQDGSFLTIGDNGRWLI